MIIDQIKENFLLAQKVLDSFISDPQTWEMLGQMASLCDVEIRAPHNGYSDRIQEIHIKVIHALVNYIEISMQRQLI